LKNAENLSIFFIDGIDALIAPVWNVVLGLTFLMK